MFRPKKMRRVRLIVLKATVETLVKELHLAGILDIRKTKYAGLEDGRPLASFDVVSGELLKLRALLAMMEPRLGRKEHGEAEIVDGRKAMAESRALGPLEEKLRALSQEAMLLSERSRLLEGEALTVEKIAHFKNVDFGKLDTRAVGYKVGEMKPENLAPLQARLEKSGGHSTLVSEAGHDAVLVVFEKKNIQAVEVVLFESGFTDMELPRSVTTPMDTANRINEESGGLKKRLAEINSEMARHAAGELGKVRSLMRSLEIEAERAEVASRFSSSKCLYVLEGWCMDADYAKVQGIAKKHEDGVFMEDVPFGHHEMPPTVLDNPKIASPLEFITKSYSMPNYYEFDPTIAYFIALPIVYGMMVGDAFYGIFSMVFSWWLMKKFKKGDMLHSVAMIWFYCGIPSILFGVIFDEYGGMTHFHLLEYIGSWTGLHLISAPLYTGFHRMADALTLIGITAIIGSLHVGLGFVLGALNEWNHNRKHAYAKLAWLGAEVGLILTLLPYLNGVFPELAGIPTILAIIGGTIFALSAIGLMVFEGVVGIVEIPSLLSNILSYARIAALGIVGVAIAEVINEYAIPLPQGGILALAMFPVFLGLHAANCLLAMFESLIQGGRLNLVEFKSKFLHGGGDIFAPFALHADKVPQTLSEA